jgi:hypothetical protein
VLQAPSYVLAAYRGTTGAMLRQRLRDRLQQRFVAEVDDARSGFVLEQKEERRHEAGAFPWLP